MIYKLEWFETTQFGRVYKGMLGLMDIYVISEVYLGNAEIVSGSMQQGCFCRLLFCLRII